jgi:hypothetical protein
MNKVSRRAFLSAAITATSAFIYIGASRESVLASSSAVQALNYLVPLDRCKVRGRKSNKSRSRNPRRWTALGCIEGHRYSIDQAWNCDQLLVLNRGASPKVFFEARTCRPLMALQNPGDVRWHPRRRDEIAPPAAIGLWNVRTETTSVLESLADHNDASSGDHKGNPPEYGRMIAATATRSDRRRVVFALETGRKYPGINVGGEHEVGRCELHHHTLRLLDAFQRT